MDCLSDMHKKVIFVVGTLENLRARGVINGGEYSMEPTGTALFDQMLADGFMVSAKEMVDIMMDGNMVEERGDAEQMATMWKTMHFLERAIEQSGFRYEITYAEE